MATSNKTADTANKVATAQAQTATSNKTTSAQAQTAAPVIPPYSADKVMTIVAAWSRSYTSVRKIKEHSAELISAHGKDNYKTIMAAYKTMMAAYIESAHTETAATLGYNAVLEREFTAVIKSAGWRKWSKLIADNWTSAAAFLAACYPHTLTDGTPARVEAYTDGKTIYKTYRPIKTDTGAAAVAVLTRALDNLKTRQTTDKTTDRKTLTRYTQTHADGVPVAAYIAEYTDKTDKTGRKYQQVTRGKDAGIQADTLARLSVLKMTKDGARLATLAEYNKDLRAE